MRARVCVCLMVHLKQERNNLVHWLVDSKFVSWYVSPCWVI